jgi:pyruvate formate lyase activating enzyme
MKRKADFFSNDADVMKCQLCPHYCNISGTFHGLCGTRSLDNETVLAENYLKVTSAAVDPIEKKPLFHFFPGSEIYSIGTFGCNLHCPFCQNWTISQLKPDHISEITPDNAVEKAIESGCNSIAFTYSEPIVWYEFVKDTAEIAKRKGLYTVMVSNGYINEKPLLQLYPLIDAWNIDLKSFNPQTYKKTLGGSLEPVLNTISFLNGKTHVEITTLIVTGMNDTDSEMNDIITFISNLNKSIPWHISRYFPNYKMNQPATNQDFIMKVYHTAKKSLDCVYVGNMLTEEGDNSYCPYCKNLLVKRSGYRIKTTGLINSKCSSCGMTLNFINGGNE